MDKSDFHFYHRILILWCNFPIHQKAALCRNTRAAVWVDRERYNSAFLGFREVAK